MGFLSKMRARFAGKKSEPVELRGNHPRQNAFYDAARTTTENQNYWANTDRFDADSAHQKIIRHEMMWRSRYELANNGFADGIAQTLATHLVGVGPSLRMGTASTGFNQLVETTWNNWAKAIQFRRKLWCMAHAKYGDGEAFGVLRKNPGVKHPIPLDVVLHEADQVQSNWAWQMEPGRIDGIKFDEFGNVLWFELLKNHPGATNLINYDPQPERVPADRMLHWFKMRRPGQHRGVPEMASTLNLGAAARRWREATLAGAETAADINVILKTAFQPEEIANVAPMSTLDIQKRMMTALPQGYEMQQMRSEFPTASHAEFHRSLINEMARPASMPFNVAACDSASYNYASGRLDHQTYYSGLDVAREDCNDLVLDPLFAVWFDLAIARFGWLGGNPDAVGFGAKAHSWDWPKHRVADVQAEATANETKLHSGQVGLDRLYSEAGLDLEDEIPQMALTFGVTEEEVRRRLFDVTLPLPRGMQPSQGELPVETSGPAKTPAAPAKPANGHAFTNRMNGNGLHVN